MSWKFIENIANMNVTQLLQKVLSMPDVQKFIINLNTEVQLFDLGIDSTGVRLSDIGGNYSQFTLSVKSRKGQPTNRVTLKDTGEFHNSFRVNPLGNGDFEITSDPIKDGVSLFERWGDDVEGLTPNNYEKVIDLLEKKILEILCK